MALSRTDGGLLVPEGAHEAAVRDALRRHDPELRLVPQDSDYFGRRIYKVFRYAGSERPAEFVLFWGDERGNPFPLSMSIVDAVQRHDRSMRGHDVRDPDEINAELRAERARESREWGEALAAEVQDRMDGRKRTVPFAGRELQLARQRARRKLPKELRPS